MVACSVLNWKYVGWGTVWRYPQGEGRDLQPGWPLATLLGPQGPSLAEETEELELSTPNHLLTQLSIFWESSKMGSRKR